MSPAYLLQETVDKFTSDFKVVADYFVQQRTMQSYTPSPQVLKHVRETLELLSVMGCDHEILEKYNSISNSEDAGGIQTMVGMIDKMLAEKGEQEAAKGRAEGNLGATIRYYQKGYLTLNQAASELGLTVDEFINKMKCFQSTAT